MFVRVLYVVCTTLVLSVVYVIVNCMYVCNLLWHGRTAMPNARVKTIKSINQSTKSVLYSYPVDFETAFSNSTNIMESIYRDGQVGGGKPKVD